MMAEEQVLSRLTALQYGPESRVLMFTQDPTGLGSQITRRILGLRLALMFDRRVVFPSLAEPPYGQVFEPIHASFDYGANLAAPSFVFGRENFEPVSLLNFWELWNSDEFRSAAFETVPSELEGRPDAKLYFDGLLLSFCRLAPEHADAVQAAKRRLGVSERTLGVHVRRGDKKVESPYVPIEVINLNIARWLKRREFDSIFIASDDPAVLSELRTPQSLPLIFDHEEKRYNNANHKFLAKNPEMSSEETRTAVKNIYLLGACGALIGQHNAHFATLAAAQIFFRTGENSSTLMNGRVALESSWALRVAHNAKSALRESVKSLLPGLTIRGSSRP